MSYRTLILLMLSTLVVIVLLAVGIGYFSAFINDKLGNNFLWIVLIVIAVLSMIYLTRLEIKNKKELTRKKSQYLQLGKLLFKDDADEFEVFYSTFMRTKNKLSSKGFTPIEVLHAFAEQKRLSLMIDWKGEENEGEIQDFINAQLAKTVSWANTAKFRGKNTDNETGEGNFIIGLLKAIDKDLKTINKKLLFFELGADTYTFTVTDTITFKEIMKVENDDFHGTEKLSIGATF